MFKHIRAVWGSWLVFGLLVLLGVSVGAIAQQAREPAEVEALKKASVNGKYSKLLVVIHVPGDQGQYTNFHDYGAYNGTSWAGYTGLPKGFWVYVAPHWYIWEQQGQGGVGGVVAPPNADQVKASVNGKYTNLLKVINVPGDAQSYGQFHDWGFWNGTSWAGFDNLPQGYWVYVAPNWYIWGQQGQQQQQQQPKGQDQVKASVNGKYVNLLKVINVPGDQQTYGDFNDWGHWTGTSWAGFDNLPQGYWVYVSPNWYIWGGLAQQQQQQPAGQDQVKASVNGKYVNLLKVINVPGDQQGYGAFHDWGFWTGTSWAGFDNLPQGYWVYVAPNWYIWGGVAQQQPPVGGNDQQKASVNGKYTNLLKMINVPGDQQSYGAFYDWGHWTGTSWAGFDNLPQGYWVYVAPNWYIWGQQGNQVQPQPGPQVPDGQPQPPPVPKIGDAPAQASVNGKYTKLLKVINVPGDQTTYGQFSDYGFYSGTSWAGYENLPPGYWVYVAPNWYIWGESQGAK